MTRSLTVPWPNHLLTLEEWEALPQQEGVRIPDLVVTHTARFEENPPRLAAADVVLAAEVLSDGTRRVDRVLKFSEYAEAGIPQYWIIDLGSPVSLLAYILVDGTYELSGEHTAPSASTSQGVASRSISPH